MKHLKFSISGLDCAACAQKIEREILKIDGVTDARIALPASAVYVDYTGDGDVLALIQAAADSVEDGVTITGQGDEDNGGEKADRFKHYRRLSFAAAVVSAVTGVSMMIAGDPTQNLFFALAAVFAGYEVALSGIKSIFKLRFNEKALMLIAIVAAAALGEMFEAAMVAVLYSLGELLEDLACGKARRDIEALSKIRPDTATVIDGGERQVPAEAVQPGDIILIKPHERVPLDCVVISGSSDIDSSALTGESLPRPCEAGDELMSGMLCGSGTLTAKVLRPCSESAASRILKTVEQSAKVKGSAERFIGRFAAVYTPIVIVCAVLIAVIGGALGGWREWTMRALTFLVASCPCALIISVPLGFYCAVGGASKLGILLKGGLFVERMAQIKAVAFDKTGTITAGTPSVTSVTPCGEMTGEEVLALAAACESVSSHPYAGALISAAGDSTAPECTDIKELPGLGVECIADGAEIICGGRRLMERRGISLAGAEPAEVYLAKDGVLQGFISLSDSVTPDARAAVKELRKQGVKHIELLTGDTVESAGRAGEETGADEWHGGLMPEDKAARIEEIRKNYGCTAFVGDGINDAPSLASSDCGIAIGLGSDAAVETADCILSGPVSALPKGIAHCRRAMRIIRANVVLALVCKAAVLALAAAGYAPMWVAVAADVGVSVAAVINSSRLIKVKL